MRGATQSSFPPAGNTIADEIAREEVAGLGYMFWGRLIVLGLLSVWVLLTLPIERSGLYFGAIAAFALLGAPPYALARRGLGGWPVAAGFLLLDACLLSYILIVPAPFTVEGWTPQLNLRLENFLYLGVFLVAMALSYSPTLVIWTGVAAIGAWSAGYLWIANLPSSVTYTSRDVLDRGLSPEAVIERFLDPQAVSLTTLYNQIAFLALATALLALTVWRSRRLVHRQVAAEHERASLSRYFSPNIVRELSTRDQPLDRPAMQPAAVLFADMVGFTGISERSTPDQLVDLLSEFLGRLARVTFAHDGTVDKYIGDSIMVHFGTPHPKADDPVRALSCAVSMIAEVERFNADREASGEVPVGIGIGLHYGQVLVGNIGDARRLEYTVLGDSVNVASRLERLTRDIDASMAVSDDVVRAVRACDVDPFAIAPGLNRNEKRTLRGRKQAVEIWTLPSTTNRDGTDTLIG